MKTILLAGYRAALGLERDANGELLIDVKIRELQRLSYEVICVLAGNDADEVLRASRYLMNVELVFDTNDAEATLATNLKAGLAATEGEGCFCIPLEVPTPEAAAWHFLREGWRREGFLTSSSVFQLSTSQGAPWQFGFPLLVSRSGNKLIRSLQGFTTLVDTRLKYQQLNLIAPVENPL
jgi:hypothetical protein